MPLVAPPASHLQPARRCVPLQPGRGSGRRSLVEVVHLRVLIRPDATVRKTQIRSALVIEDHDVLTAWHPQPETKITVDHPRAHPRRHRVYAREVAGGDWIGGSMGLS